MGKKGFFLTLDVILALMLISIVMLIVLSMDLEGEMLRNANLRAFSMSMLTSFEKSSMLAQGLSNPPVLRQALNSLPPNICAQISIMNSTNSTLVDVQKSQCTESGNTFIIYRTLYSNGELYLARSKTWYK